jgi:putative Mn2+ efflux pump MntP
LTGKQTADSAIQDYIIEIVTKEKPQTVNHLLKSVQLKYPKTEQEIIRIIMHMQEEGKIHLTETETPSSTLTTFVLSSKATWFWTTILLVLATVAAVFTIPEDAYPAVYVRYVLGSLFVLWLPGYTLIKVLFPAKKEMDKVERIALSIGLSLAQVPIVGLLLNYTPWGIRLAPITLSLLTLTIVFAAAAITREYQTTTKKTTS